MTRNHALAVQLAAAAGVAAMALAMAAGSANARTPATCVPQAAELVDQLGELYGEALTAAGIDANGNVVQVYSSEDEGTWTIAITAPGGTTCVLSAGEGWNRELAVEPPKPGNPV